MAQVNAYIYMFFLRAYRSKPVYTQITKYMCMCDSAIIVDYLNPIMPGSYGS